MNEHTPTPEPYPEVIVFIIGCLIAIALLTFVYFRDTNGMERFCKNNPTECAPAIYPGKVEK